MKATRKLIPAIALLLISAVMMATASFAWFSMNTTVTATNMQVTAKTDNAFLIIAAGTTLTGTDTSADGTMDATLYPTKPVATLSSTNINTITNWGTASSTDADDANSEAEVTPLTTDDTLTDYVAKQSFVVGIVENSGTVANALHLASLTISDLDSGITVVVVCGTNIYTYDENVTSGTDELAADSAVTTTGVQVDVYVYIDGSNENVKTTNATNLAGSISMVFSIA